MSRKIRFVGQFNDPQVELQMIEVVRISQELIDDLAGAQQNILVIDEFLQEAETKQGATDKANQAEQNAKNYASQVELNSKAYADQVGVNANLYVDQEIEKVKPKGGSTASRPTNMMLFGSYFDTTLGIPIWWDGTKWVDAGGVTV